MGSIRRPGHEGLEVGKRVIPALTEVADGRTRMSTWLSAHIVDTVNCIIDVIAGCPRRIPHVVREGDRIGPDNLMKK